MRLSDSPWSRSNWTLDIRAWKEHTTSVSQQHDKQDQGKWDTWELSGTSISLPASFLKNWHVNAAWLARLCVFLFIPTQLSLSLNRGTSPRLCVFFFFFQKRSQRWQILPPDVNCPLEERKRMERKSGWKRREKPSNDSHKGNWNEKKRIICHNLHLRR